MYALAIHGGAGALPPRTLSAEREAAFHAGLAQALGAAQAILEADGCALDASRKRLQCWRTIRFSTRAGCRSDDGRHGGNGRLDHGRRTAAGGRGRRGPARAQSDPAGAPVLEDTPHVFLVGEEPTDLPSRLAWRWWPTITSSRRSTPAARGAPLHLKQQAQVRARCPRPSMSRVWHRGAVARDGAGRLAAATSTGGMNGKRPDGSVIHR